MQASGAGWELTRVKEEGFWWARVVRSERCCGLDAPLFSLWFVGKSVSGPPSGPIQEHLGWLPGSGPRGPDAGCLRVNIGDVLRSHIKTN